MMADGDACATGQGVVGHLTQGCCELTADSATQRHSPCQHTSRPCCTLQVSSQLVSPSYFTRHSPGAGRPGRGGWHCRWGRPQARGKARRCRRGPPTPPAPPRWGCTTPASSSCRCGDVAPCQHGCGGRGGVATTSCGAMLQHPLKLHRPAEARRHPTLLDGAKALQGGSPGRDKRWEGVAAGGRDGCQRRQAGRPAVGCRSIGACDQAGEADPGLCPPEEGSGEGPPGHWPAWQEA